MPRIKHLTLDVLKPHTPNALDFASAIVQTQQNTQVKLTVAAVDEKTESTVIEIHGPDIQYELLVNAITELGGSIHSIDEVIVGN